MEKISTNEVSFLHLDSVKNSGHPTESIVEKVFSSITMTSLYTKYTIVYPKNVPRQSNGYDSGLFVLNYIQDIVNFVASSKNASKNKKSLMDSTKYITDCNSRICSAKRKAMLLYFNKAFQKSNSN